MSDGWKDMSTAPETGSFLVWLERPDLGCQQAVMTRRRGMNSVVGAINGRFHWDAPKPLLWRPLPEDPVEKSAERGA